MQEGLIKLNNEIIIRLVSMMFINMCFREI